MTRRVCLMAVANDFIDTLLAAIPGVVVTGKRECFERAVSVVRLEGPTLPDWCESPMCGEPYAWATVRFDGDGKCEFHQAAPLGESVTMTFCERIVEQYSNPN